MKIWDGALVSYGIDTFSVHLRMIVEGSRPLHLVCLTVRITRKHNQRVSVETTASSVATLIRPCQDGLDLALVLRLVVVCRRSLRNHFRTITELAVAILLEFVVEVAIMVDGMRINATLLLAAIEKITFLTLLQVKQEEIRARIIL